MPKPPAPAEVGTPLRLARFNVRSAYFSPGDARSWLHRAPDVARKIVSSKAGVVALQEASPGRADGVPGAAGAAVPRQTESLAAALVAVGGPQ